MNTTIDTPPVDQQRLCLPAFLEFPKLARLSRECIITEKIDGINAQILISEDGSMMMGSRTRWITPEQDNHGFARWAMEHREELLQLGPGRHSATP